MRLRSLLVGDSFLECAFLLGSPSAFVEQDLATAVHIDMETINFGVSATGPRHYYQRVKKRTVRGEYGSHLCSCRREPEACNAYGYAAF